MHSKDITASCAALVSTVAAEPWGRVAVSLYDTGRLVAIAPWLAGHRARVDFLCRRQRADGGWGGPDGYALVPTLSATAALLAELRRPAAAGPAPDPSTVRRAVTGGLSALRRWLPPAGRVAVPDTIGVELIVPALLEELQRESREQSGTDPAGTADQLRLPAGLDGRLWQLARERFATGPLPQKSWACLEVFGPAVAGAEWVRPAMGSVGCSAAATAAWLGRPDRDRPAQRFLTTLQARGGGPVPGVTPITFFEAAWVLNSLAQAGMPASVPAPLLDRLAAGLTAEGAPAAPGLPADADDTAAVLTALLRHGRPRPPDSLLDYRHGDRFCCFVGERTPSVSTNAHVLEALAVYLAYRPASRSRYAGPAGLAATWLLSRQESDGSWADKWHASPYYATACCVQALAQYGEPVARPAIGRAADWLLERQRPDGSWGRWAGTVEETSYAVQTLAIAVALTGAPTAAAAIARGASFLAGERPADHPPLWHAKDLYAPVTVIEAARLAALALAGRVAAPAPVGLGSR